MAVPKVTVTVNHIRATLAEAVGWGRPSDVTGPLALAGVLHPPAGRAPGDGRAGDARAPEVATASVTTTAAERRGRARHTSPHTVRG